MYALILSTAVIFVAELGDKSQLMAMTFATRYRTRDVLIGITAATALVHLASVVIGHYVGAAFASRQWIVSIVAGVAFLVFAAWTLRADHNWLGVWIGSTVGMVAADALAIVLGAVLGKKLPERLIKIVASLAFLVFGIILIIEGITSR